MLAVLYMSALDNSLFITLIWYKVLSKPPAKREHIMPPRQGYR